jgi:hypothetical protein
MGFYPRVERTSTTYGVDGTGYDVTMYGDTASAYWQWDQSADDMILAGSASVQTAQTGTGYSFNLVSVTSTTASGNTRGWRVNTTTSNSITHGDLQCVHGYLTMGTGVTLGTGAAVYPLSAWIDVPSDITTGSGNVIAGLRAIFDANGVDLGSLAGGGESALAYLQTWGGNAGVLDHGVRVVAGTSTTIGNGISFGGAGTFTRLIDWTEGPAGFVTLATWSTADAQTRHLNWYMGDSTSRAAVWAEVSVVDGLGSLYFSSTGKIYVRTNNAGASTDWERVTTSAAD